LAMMQRCLSAVTGSRTSWSGSNVVWLTFSTKYCQRNLVIWTQKTFIHAQN
jgi:hypothetical protein